MQLRWIAVLLAVCAVSAVAEPRDVGEALQQSFVWVDSVPTGQQAYVAFRRGFDLPEKPDTAALRLFADSRYILWINGRYVLRGPCRFDPKGPEYDTVDVREYLVSGRNALVVLVHHCHDGQPVDDPRESSSRIMRHAPGLTLDLTWTAPGGTTGRLTSDTAWRACAKTRFQPGPIQWGALLDNIDARLDPGDWTQADFDDAAWEPAVPVSGALWGPLRARAIPLLRETPLTPERVVRASAGTPAPDAPLNAALPITLAEGAEIVLDLGRMTLAYDLVDLEAGAGAVLEVSHGHGYADGRLDETYGANRYTARAGRQQYVSGDQQGFRYMLLRAAAGSITLHGIQVVERLYPFERAGSFACNDAFLNELWERSVWTTQLCSEDGYEDCTARERAEWMGDAAIAEYPMTRAAFATRNADGTMCWSDPRLIRNMLRHIAQSQQPDGRLKAHHPSDRWDIHGYIEDYACLWVRTLGAYYTNTDDLELVRELWPALTKQLQWFLDHRTANGLVLAREFVFADNPLAYKVCEGTTLNAYVAGAFETAADLARALGDNAAAPAYRDAATELKAQINQYLWDPDARAYHGGIMDGAKTPPNAFAAMVALYFGVVPENERAGLFDWLAEHRKEVGTPYSHHFLLADFFAADQPEFDRLALDTMRERWASTLARKDVDTVFEGFGGGALCHNIGATAACFLSSHVLGVRREGPLAEHRIRIEPHLGDLTRAEGVVITECGPVPVAWTWSETEKALEFRFEIPANTQADLALPAFRGVPAVTLDRAALNPSELHTQGQRVVLSVGAGPHAGRAAY